MRCKREQFWWWFRSSLLVLSRLTIDVVGFLSGSGSKYAIKLEPVLHQFGHPTSQQEDILSSLCSRLCAGLNGCDHLQYLAVIIYKTAWSPYWISCRGWPLRETAAFPWVGVVSVPPADTPPEFGSREYCLFFQDFDTLFYLRFFFSIQIWLGG